MSTVATSLEYDSGPRNSFSFAFLKMLDEGGCSVAVLERQIALADIFPLTLEKTCMFVIHIACFGHIEEVALPNLPNAAIKIIKYIYIYIYCNRQAG